MSELRSVDIKSVDDFATDYDVKHKIGEGMFSNVWLCVQRDNGQEYAAKILKNNYGSTMNADDWNSIIELNVAKTVLKHPFLLMLERCYHERSGPGRVIMVSELMKRSLYDVIEAGECPLPANRIKSYTYQLLEGVKYMHENGFIHRDIKPENILLKDKLLKLADFGTACHVTAGQPYTSYVATRWYRSPECLLTSGWYGTKMDIWSVGCVLYEIATGRPLFDGENEYDQVDKIDRVLGRPDARLMCKFKKHSSDIFDQQYNNSTATRTGARGIGLHTVYKPFWPSYDVLKDMITYDPAKRYSADRLLRKPYFQEMKNTEYDYKIKKFQEAAMKNSRRPTKNNSSGEGKLDLPKRIPLSSIDKKHEGGDHVQQTSRERCMTQNVKKGQETHSFNKNQQSGGKNTIASDINRKQMPKTMTGIIAKSNNNLPLKKQYINSIPKLSRNPLINPNVKSKSLMKRPPFK